MAQLAEEDLADELPRVLDAVDSWWSVLALSQMEYPLVM
jgi:hypothetical protein